MLSAKSFKRFDSQMHDPISQRFCKRELPTELAVTALPVAAARSKRWAAAALVTSALGCLACWPRDARSDEAKAAATPAAPTAAKSAPAQSSTKAAPKVAAEATLGLRDTGLWSDLDAKLQLPAPTARPEQVTAVVNPARDVLVLEVDGWPVKAYPLGSCAASVDPYNSPAHAAPSICQSPLRVGPHTLYLRAGDRAELLPLLSADRLRALPPPASAIAGKPAVGDRDGDGIPDALDVLLGAKKTVLNADAYTGGYVRIDYPMGDVPRTIGVCTDVVVRALRNAGIDLQRDLHEDIRRAPRSYPMVRGRGDPNIDHRRVKTLLPLFLRKWRSHTVAFDDTADPLRPGDIVFMDTFPSRSGPDHIGIVSDRLGPSGLPLIINNWTDGTVTTEMDLLTFVPVTHRFRLWDK